MKDKLKVEIPSWDYIRELFQEKDKVALFLKNYDTGEGRQHIVTAGKAWAFKYQKYLQAMNSQGFNIYIGMNPLKDTATGRLKEDIREVKRIFLDIDEDGENAKNTILKDPYIPNPNYLLESSPDKYQMVWNVKGFDLESAEGLIHAMALRSGADVVVRDISRVMRIPGFRNKKPDYKYVEDGKGPIVGVSRMAKNTYAREDFKLDLSEIAYSTTRGREGHRQPMNGITQSERDWAYVKSHIERGEDPSLIMAAVAEYRKDDGKGSDYAKRTVEKAVDVMRARDSLMAGESIEAVKDKILKEGSRLGNRNPGYPEAVVALAEKEVALLSDKNGFSLNQKGDEEIHR